MSFLNLGLLAGATALMVPLLIHLLSRRRKKPLAWGAMFLIEQVVQRDRRRVRVERWLLLLMRCAVPVLLALAMARPVLDGWRALLGDQPASAVIVLDASYSMSAEPPDAATPADAARAAARRALQSLPAGSDAVLLVAGGGLQRLGPAAAFSAPIALEPLLDGVNFDRGPMDLPAALAAADSALRDARHRRRDVILVSDFRGASPPPPKPAGDDAPLVTFVRVGPDAPQSLANVGVDDLRLSPALPGVGRPVRVRASLRNTGPVDLADLAVRLDVDGVARDETRLALAAGATRDVDFTARFPAAGGHSATVRVAAPGDRVPGDDALSVAVDLPESLPVLVVAGETGRPFGENPADFLALALDPKFSAAAAPAVELASLLRPKIVRAADLDAAATADTRVVILADVPRLNDVQTKLLNDFVRGGGGLIVFPGPRAETDYYDAAPLFPATLGAIQTGDAHLADGPYTFAPLLAWNDPGNGRLGEATIRRWYALTPKPAGDPPPKTVATLAAGGPFLVEQPVGRGVVLMAATSASADWSDLPLRAAFVPLVQQLAAYAAVRDLPPRTVAAGQPLALPLADDRAPPTLIGPDGERHAMRLDDAAGRRVARFDDTFRPGLYRAEPGGAVFAADAPRGDLDAPPPTAADVEQLAAASGATLAAGAGEYAALDQQRRFGRELWPAACAAVIVLLFAELFVQRERREQQRRRP